MPLALVAIAWLLVMTGINGNYAAVGKQFETDVLNNGQSGGFLQFMAGLVGIAVFFRVIGLPNAGRVFLVLVLIVFMLQNANILTTLENINATTASAAPSTTSSSASAAPTSSSASAAPTTGETSGTGTST